MVNPKVMDVLLVGFTCTLLVFWSFLYIGLTRKRIQFTHMNILIRWYGISTYQVQQAFQRPYVDKLQRRALGISRIRVTAKLSRRIGVLESRISDFLIRIGVLVRYQPNVQSYQSYG